MGRARKYASAAERQAAYIARKNAKSIKEQGEEALKLLDSKIGNSLKEGATQVEDLLEMSLEALHETGLKDTTIKFILQKQLEVRQDQILNDKERALKQSLAIVEEKLDKIAIRHGLQQEVWDDLAPSMPPDWANTWEK